MDKKDRICMFCEKLNIENSAFGSTWTGQYGEDGFSCNAGHFDEYDKGKVDTLEEMRALFRQASSCPDYEQELDKGD